MLGVSHAAAKRIHVTMHTLALGVSIVGVASQWANRATNGMLFAPPLAQCHSCPLMCSSGINHIHTAHSRIGVVALALFGVQWAMGLHAFLVSGDANYKAWLKPLHGMLGFGLVALLNIVMLLGLVEVLTFGDRDLKTDSEKTRTHLVVDIAGALIIANVIALATAHFLRRRSAKEVDYVAADPSERQALLPAQPSLTGTAKVSSAADADEQNTDEKRAWVLMHIIGCSLIIPWLAVVNAVDFFRLIFPEAVARDFLFDVGLANNLPRWNAILHLIRSILCVTLSTHPLGPCLRVCSSLLPDSPCPSRVLPVWSSSCFSWLALPHQR